MTVTRALRGLANGYGVLTAYEDVTKKRRTARTEGLIQVLRILGAPIDRPADAAAALEQLRARQQTRLVEPVMVAWEGRLARIQVRCPPTPVDVDLTISIQLEAGEVQERRWRSSELEAPSDAPQSGMPQPGAPGRRCAWSVRWARRLPYGYHRLRVTCGAWTGESLIVSSPRRLAANSSLTTAGWGIFAPIYSLHDANSWGIGGLREFGEFAGWVQAQGGSLVATLPLLASFFDNADDVSPYAPASRLFWNELYVDVTRSPEYANCPAARRIVESADFQQELAELRRDPAPDPRRFVARRRQVLELLAEQMGQAGGARRDEFDQFVRASDDLLGYAGFRAACERWGRPWSLWPLAWREGNLPPEILESPACRYHQYVQWLAHEQLDQLAQTAQSGGMTWYLDLPLGTHGDGYDVWRYRDEFALGAAGGAPPDGFFTKGQNWGFPPLHPQRMRERHYDYFRRVLGHHLRQARLLRLDHVMGLHRLYWVPDGLSASEGVYVRYPAGELYAVLLLEAHRFQASLIGENLGTVPSYVNRAMHRHGLGRLYVVQYEAESLATTGRCRPPDADEVASLNTHDMPTFAAWWHGRDIDDRLELGLLKPAEVGPAREARGRLRTALIELLFEDKSSPPEASDAALVLQACWRWLARSDAPVMLINLEDLWLETAPQNTPGTVDERVNWRRKARQSLDQLRQSPAFATLLHEVDRLRRDAVRPDAKPASGDREVTD